MSVIAQFAIFPIDKGESLSEYVAGSLKIIKDSGLPYVLGPMGTGIEGEWDDVMSVIDRCFKEMSGKSNRVY
ncbi:MAG: MTH1187 family thiamine-binding protein, partial [Spirochaetes bacterium]|nr:MTH1187 family thiamine-binding protein [Spirochaetota bacterium]